MTCPVFHFVDKTKCLCRVVDRDSCLQQDAAPPPRPAGGPGRPTSSVRAHPGTRAGTAARSRLGD